MMMIAMLPMMMMPIFMRIEKLHITYTYACMPPQGCTQYIWTFPTCRLLSASYQSAAQESRWGWPVFDGRCQRKLCTRSETFHVPWWRLRDKALRQGDSGE